MLRLGPLKFRMQQLPRHWVNDKIVTGSDNGHNVAASRSLLTYNMSDVWSSQVCLCGFGASWEEIWTWYLWVGLHQHMWHTNNLRERNCTNKKISRLGCGRGPIHSLLWSKRTFFPSICAPLDFTFFFFLVIDFSILSWPKWRLGIWGWVEMASHARPFKWWIQAVVLLLKFNCFYL